MRGRRVSPTITVRTERFTRHILSARRWCWTCFLGGIWAMPIPAATCRELATGFASGLIGLGLSSNFASNYQGGQGPFTPSFGVSGYLGGAGESRQDTRYADDWAFGGNFTKIIGRHTLKMGANFATNNTRSPIYNENEGFTATPTQNPANSTAGEVVGLVLTWVCPIARADETFWKPSTAAG